MPKRNRKKIHHSRYLTINNEEIEVNASNKFVYSLMTTLYKICEPSLKIVQRFIPVFGNIDISPIIVFVLLEFLKYLILK